MSSPVPCRSGEGIITRPRRETKEGSDLAPKGRPDLGREGVSEVIGSLILVAIVVIGIAIVGVLLLANPTPSKVPVFHPIISNQSRTIYLYHKGGDPLWMGQFKILVDGGDQTGNFTFLSPGSDPWSVGETLTAVAPVMPKRVAIILNQSGGGATILSVQDFVPSVSIPLAENPWFFNDASGRCDWDYRKKITIDRTRVWGSHTNFPVLVSIDADAELAARAQKDGDDILFTSSDGTTKLPHEIESYRGNTGTLVAWVKLPSLTNTTNTEIYLYYGNTTSTSQQSASSVWDSYYAGVWHLNEVVTDEATGGTHSDSTSPQNNGVQYRNDEVSGKINRSQYFDGTADYVTVSDSNDIDMTASQDFTVSAWVNTNLAPVAGTWPAMVRKVDDDGSPADGYSLILHSGLSGPWYIEIYDGGSIYTAAGDLNIADSSWHYIAGVRTGAALIAYEDGNLADRNPGGSSGDLSQGYPLRLASNCATPPNGLMFTGTLDEVRVSKTARSADWVKTEYNNQNSPSSFYALGGEEQWWKC
jgi:flagellin-like protein